VVSLVKLKPDIQNIFFKNHSKADVQSLHLQKMHIKCFIFRI